MTRLIKERADEADPTVPGDCTGLIVKRIFNTKVGVYIEARVDFVTLKELDSLGRCIAQELGEVNQQ